jgi:small redox-active disulfide protein 2
MKIQALGGCCKKSQANYEAVVLAVKELGLDVQVEHITDMNEIMNLGVLATPGLIIDEKIVSVGRTLNVKQAKELINKAINSSSCCSD